MILAMILCDSDCVGVRTAGASPAASSSTSGVVQPRHTPVSHHQTPLTATNTNTKHQTSQQHQDPVSLLISALSSTPSAQAEMRVLSIK